LFQKAFKTCNPKITFSDSKISISKVRRDAGRNYGGAGSKILYHSFTSFIQIDVGPAIKES